MPKAIICLVLFSAHIAAIPFVTTTPAVLSAWVGR